MRLRTIKVEKPHHLNVIIGQSEYHTTLEEIRRALETALPGLQFGLAFRSGCSTETCAKTGTNLDLVGLAERNAARIDVRGTFFLFLENASAVPVMKALKQIPAIRKIFCATPNQVEVIVVEGEKGRGVMGLVDDYAN